jgi:outer membrane protein TolC
MHRNDHGFKKCRKGLLSAIFLVISNFLVGQTAQDTLPPRVTLSQCITYALKNQALIKQSILDEDIARKDIRIALSGWYPQLEADANVEHFLKAPIAYFPDMNNPPEYTPYIALNSTAKNISTGIFSVNQTLYSNDLFLASRTSGELQNQASENTENSKINTYVDVTKAFFDVLLTEEQINVLKEDILRLQHNFNDAYSYYKSGMTDKIDYQRTEISLSNTQAQRKSAEEALKAKYSVLKHLMGVVPEKQFTVLYDSSKFENEIIIDTTKNLNYNNRIEYQLLQTTLKLQNFGISYYKWSFLPTLSAFYNYDPSFANNQFSDLYKSNNPTSLVEIGRAHV